MKSAIILCVACWTAILMIGCVIDNDSSSDGAAGAAEASNESSLIAGQQALSGASDNEEAEVDVEESGGVANTNETNDTEASLQLATMPDEGDPCARFASGFARCMNERCPPTAPVREITERSAEMFCILGHAAGTLTDTDLERAVNPETDCGNRSVDQIFEPRLRDDGAYAIGDLSQFCSAGPLREVNLCVEACANLEPCIDANSDAAFLRNEAFCQEFCVSREGPTTEQWSCAIDYNSCTDIFQCFENRPVPICEAFSSFGAACLTERCPAAMPLEVGAADLFNSACRSGIRDGSVSPTGYRRTLDSESCSRGYGDILVSFITEDWAGEPASGGLETFCEGGGPVQPVSTCDAACARVTECIPHEEDGTRFGDPDVCQFYCQASDNFPGDFWECLADSPGCASLGRCFQ